MTEAETVSAATIEALRQLDTPTVCNALEIVCPERRGYGYTVEHLHCVHPDLTPVVAYARTARIGAMKPSELEPREQGGISSSYYAYVASGPTPSVMVIEDIDPIPGFGAWWGEVNTNVHLGLGCQGVVTNGSIRDLADVADGFQLLAAKVGPSHAFVHVVDFGEAVEVSGMRVCDGELIHADRHGAVVVPGHLADEVPAAAALIARREGVVIEASKRGGFSVEDLRRAWGDAAEIH